MECLDMGKYKGQEWIKCKHCSNISPVGLWNRRTYEFYKDELGQCIEPIKLDGTIPDDCDFICPVCHSENISEDLKEVN